MNTNTLIRRAWALGRALNSYPFPVDQNIFDCVALVVTCEEYAQLKSDPELWDGYARGEGVLDFHVPMEGASEIRLCGVLVLPHE